MRGTSLALRAHARHATLGRLVGSVLALGVVFGCSDTATTEPEQDPEPLPAVDLQEGTTLGTPVFEVGNTASGGQGEPVSGVGCIDVIAAHYHAHVSLYVEGERIALPAGVGVVDPVLVNGFVQAGSCLYWLHTHDATGLVHVEPPVNEEFTLGQFFDIWGQPLSSSGVAGFSGEVSVFVDGQRFHGDLKGIVLASGVHVSLQVGRPLAPPPMYNFQS